MEDKLDVDPPKAEPTKKLAKAESKPAMLVYSGPSQELFFGGVSFRRGEPTEADPELVAQMRAHKLASEGHSLYAVE